MGERGDTHTTPRPRGRHTRRRARRTLARTALAAGLVVGAAACTQPGGPGGGHARGSFSMLTYNVAGLPQEISTENPREHIPLISPLLNEYDVVLTQEDFDWWMPVVDQLDFVHYHERLRAQATHEYRSEQHPGPEAVGIDPAARGMFVGDGNGVLSRLPFTGNTRVPWAGCFGGIDTSDGGAGDCLAMKGFAMVTMTLPSGALVDVYTLHAEAGGTAEDQRLQGEDYSQLADFIAATSGGSGRDRRRRHQPAHRRHPSRRRGRGRHRDLAALPRRRRSDRRVRGDRVPRHRLDRQDRVPQRRGRPASRPPATRCRASGSPPPTATPSATTHRWWWSSRGGSDGAEPVTEAMARARNVSRQSRAAPASDCLESPGTAVIASGWRTRSLCEVLVRSLSSGGRRPRGPRR